MATINQFTAVMSERTVFSMVRRAQASIASYQHFDNGDLSKYLIRDSFMVMAERLVKLFFTGHWI